MKLRDFVARVLVLSCVVSFIAAPYQEALAANKREELVQNSRSYGQVTKQSVSKPIKTKDNREKMLLVKYKDEGKAEEVKSKVRGKKSLEKLEAKKRITGKNIEFLEVGEKDNRDGVIKELRKNPDVVYAHENYKLYSTEIEDSRFNEQWGLYNVGQAVNGQAGTAGADIKAKEEWNVTSGSSNVVIGVLDLGIDISHSDLQSNIFVNSGEIPGNGIDDDGNGYIDDVNGYDFQNNDATVCDSPTLDKH